MVILATRNLRSVFIIYEFLVLYNFYCEQALMPQNCFNQLFVSNAGRGIFSAARAEFKAVT